MAESGSSAVGYGSMTVSTAAVDFTGTGVQFQTATHVLVSVEAAPIRFRTDGTAPTASEGHLVNAGDNFTYSGQLSKLQMIRQGGSDATVRCTFSYR